MKDMEDHGTYINTEEIIIEEIIFPILCNNFYKLLWEINWIPKLYVSKVYISIKITDRPYRNSKNTINTKYF